MDAICNSCFYKVQVTKTPTHGYVCPACNAGYLALTDDIRDEEVGERGDILFELEIMELPTSNPLTESVRDIVNPFHNPDVPDDLEELWRKTKQFIQGSS